MNMYVVGKHKSQYGDYHCSLSVSLGKVLPMGTEQIEPVTCFA